MNRPLLFPDSVLQLVDYSIPTEMEITFLLQWPNQATKKKEIDTCLQESVQGNGRTNITFLYESL